MALRQMAECEFSDYPGVTQDQPVVEQPHESRATGPKVVNPDGGVDEDHEASLRRLEISVSAGSVPPSLANRRALSR